MRWVKVVSVAVCLGALSVVACIVVLEFRPDASRPANIYPSYDPRFVPPLLPAHPQPEIVWQPAPEFQAWLATRYPPPGPGYHPWLGAITGATKSGNTVVVSTWLPSDRTAVEPAKIICAVAIDFMTANPDRGLRNVGVTGVEQGELVRGGLDYPCEIGPYLRSRL